jgi:predicted DsbA family dithiol-disulfide isomerase
MADGDPGLARELQVEVRGIHRWAPDLPIAVPRGKPNTARPIAAAAAAFRQAPTKAHRFKSSLYEAFWRDGRDISSPEVIDDLARAAGLTDPLDLAAVSNDVARWQGEWLGSGLGSVPSMVRSDGQALVGLASLEDLRSFFSGIVRVGESGKVSAD